MQNTRNRWFHPFVVVLAAGVVYYFLFTRLLGYAAAIAAPSWLLPLMEQNPSTGLLVMSLLTHIPAIAIAAAIVGYALARLLPRQHFFLGVLTVCTMVLFSAVAATGGLGFWVQLRESVIPRYLFAVPTLIALWSFLPVAAHLFARSRRSRNIDRAAASA